MIFRIRFQGNEYLLIGEADSGAIATEEQWNNFALNYAHLREDGKVCRFGVVIGTIEDIELLEPIVIDDCVKKEQI